MTAVISVPLADVIGHRYARRAVGGAHLGHLLTRTWEAPPGRGRPALCGARATKWKPTDVFAEPGKFQDCPDCTRAAGLDTPRTAVRIAPADPQPTGGRRAGLAVTPVEHLTQAERTQRRTTFAATFRASRRGDYVPLDGEAAAVFQAHRGVADGWPIPLTRCTPKTTTSR